MKTMAYPPESVSRDAVPRRSVIEVICGCMFSGKTSELLRQLRAEPAAAIAVFKHSRDDRYSRSRIMTHTGDGCEAINVSRAGQILDAVPAGAEVVAIDEGHFFDEALPEVCQQLASRGKRVIVTTLDLDMWGLPFETIEQLRQMAAEVHVQRAVCAVCGGAADHTHRKTPIRERNLVGGTSDFEPRCAACWRPPPEERILLSDTD